MDLREQFETEIGDGPALPPIQERLRAGRRALRIRRGVAGLAVAGAITAIGLTSYAVTGPTPHTGRDFAGQPSASTSRSPEPTTNDIPVTDEPGPGWICGDPNEPTDCSHYNDNMTPVFYQNGRHLVRRDAGVTVTRLVLLPVEDLGVPNAAVEAVDDDGRTHWLFLEGETSTATSPEGGGGSGVSGSYVDDIADPDGSFDDWIADVVADPPPVFTVDSGGTD